MRDRSPIPPPREPKRDAMWLRERDRMDRFPPPRGGGGGRRSPSPPPYKRHRREDDFYDRHERYSSPPRHRGRSPDYGRYDDYDYYSGGGGHNQPPPPPRRDDRRGGGGGDSAHHAGSGPMSFKQFLVQKVGDDVSPQEAQELYDQYLTQHFGNQLRARFEQEKGQKGVYAAFHPNAFESSLVRHQEGAAAAASLLAADIQDGKLEPSAPGFNQGLVEGDEADGAEGAAAAAAAAGKERPQAPEGPMCLWKAARAVQDYKVAKKLVAVVDHQRGLQLADNPLLPQGVIAAAAAAGAGAGEGEGAQEGGKDVDMADGQADGAKAAADGAEAAASAGGADAEALLRAVLAAVDAEEVSCDEDSALLDRLGQLDLLLTWLWRVHGIDYYAGKELLLEVDFVEQRSHKQRTIRGPRPEEGEEQDEEEAKVELAELAERVDKVWAARLEQPDPLLQGCQREEIQGRLDAWMESQIRQEGEKKWGSSFSSKYFLEKRFVVKHILNKHQDKLAEHKDVIRADLYWERYEAAKLAEREAKRRKQRADAAAAAAGAHADDEAADDWQDGGEGDDGRGWGRGMRGRGMHGRGRGLHPAPGGMLGDLPIVDPAQMMLMGGLPGPIILPGPGMMGGMPGAIPLGGPMVFDPAMLAGDLGGMPIILPGGPHGGRGGRGMARGRGGRGVGGRGAPPGTKLEGAGYLKHYYDLDAPANNRAVLDYGDL